MTVELASVRDEAYSRGNDIFDSPVTPGNPPKVVAIDCQFDRHGVLVLHRIEGGATVKEELNGGAELQPGKLYAFETRLARGQSLNLEYTADAQINTVLVTEED